MTKEQIKKQVKALLDTDTKVYTWKDGRQYNLSGVCNRLWEYRIRGCFAEDLEKLNALTERLTAILAFHKWQDIFDKFVALWIEYIK